MPSLCEWWGQGLVPSLRLVSVSSGEAPKCDYDLFQQGLPIAPIVTISSLAQLLLSQVHFIGFNIGPFLVRSEDDLEFQSSTEHIWTALLPGWCTSFPLALGECQAAPAQRILEHQNAHSKGWQLVATVRYFWHQNPQRKWDDSHAVEHGLGILSSCSDGAILVPCQNKGHPKSLRHTEDKTCLPISATTHQTLGVAIETCLAMKPACEQDDPTVSFSCPPSSLSSDHVHKQLSASFFSLEKPSWGFWLFLFLEQATVDSSYWQPSSTSPARAQLWLLDGHNGWWDISHLKLAMNSTSKLSKECASVGKIQHGISLRFSIFSRKLMHNWEGLP